jgi:hypothetical protein
LFSWRLPFWVGWDRISVWFLSERNA